MRRIPIIATLIVGAAIAAMVTLGIWQIRRAEWKDGLLDLYRVAARAPALTSLPVDRTPDELAFRRIEIGCQIATAPIPLGGTQAGAGPGFRNIAGCELADGRLIMVDLGWSAIGAKVAPPPIGTAVAATGPLIPDQVLLKRVLRNQPKAQAILIVLDRPAEGFVASIPPSIEEIPNNHRAYAVQWFLFAGVALIIFVLALRRRARREED